MIEIGIEIQVQQKIKTTEEENRKILTATDVYKLKEVQEIKSAIQEHFYVICLNNQNDIRNISLIGIGSSSKINIELKDIIRTALINATNKVIFVHNHPSNDLHPSKADIELTNTVGVYLKSFGISVIDHIIAGDDTYLSMASDKYINLDYKNQRIYAMQNSLLYVENNKLKKEIEELKEKVNEQENKIDDEMEL